MATHGGKLAARALKLAGVDCIFTLSGGHVMPIYDGALDEGIRVIDVRHEQAAVHAADAYSRLNPTKLGCAVPVRVSLSFVCTEPRRACKSLVGALAPAVDDATRQPGVPWAGRVPTFAARRAAVGDPRRRKLKPGN